MEFTVRFGNDLRVYSKVNLSGLHVCSSIGQQAKNHCQEFGLNLWRSAVKMCELVPLRIIQDGM